MKKHFKPTKTKVDIYRLARVGPWTTNGHWIILTEHEPTWLKKLKTSDARDLQVEPVIEDALRDAVDIELNGRLQYLEKFNTILAKFDAEDFSSWVNVYYLAMFDSLDADFQQRSPESAIIVKSEGKLVGLMMPVRVPGEF